MSTISRPWSGSASRIFGKAVSALLLAATLSLTGCGDGTRVNMFEGTTAEQAMTELSRKIGHPARAFNVDITPLSLAVRVQDPAKPSHIDRRRARTRNTLSEILFIRRKRDRPYPVFSPLSVN